MNARHSLLAAALTLALGGAAAAEPLSAVEATALLERNGFTEVQLEYRDGGWAGTAINADGDVADVRVDPVSREVQWSAEQTRTTVTTTTTSEEPVATVVTEPVVVEETVPVVRKPIVVAQRVLVPVGGRLNRNDIREVLAASGYHAVRDIGYRDGAWVAHAKDPSDFDMELRIDPVDGEIVRVGDY